MIVSGRSTTNRSFSCAFRKATITASLDSALAMMGKMEGEIRPPLYPMSGANREKLRKILAEMKLI